MYVNIYIYYFHITYLKAKIVVTFQMLLHRHSADKKYVNTFNENIYHAYSQLERMTIQVYYRKTVE